MSETALLAVSRLNAFYGAAHILFDLAFEVRAGEVVALMGRNGAGKSTTLKSVMGLIERKTGAISFAGEDISHVRPHEIARLGLGYVPEDRRIFTDLTVAENLEVGRQPARSDEAWTPERLFELFPNLAEARHRLGGRLSGGEQQMLTVARTLMGNPRLILLDEPSEGVAPIIVDAMADMMLALKKTGVAIVLSEQNLPFAELVSDRAYVIEKGEMRFSGTMRDLSANEELRRAHLEV
ncbi:MAG TPA: ABC transporter ATP-binding protein [Beijerinckiaceae bacterium]|nr:ABC transporter ATP-binding protein [Beijerinckiaceae bacterium]